VSGGPVSGAPVRGGPVRRAAIVTGGSRGIGLAVAGALVDQGLALTLVARHPDRLAAAAEGLRGRGGEVATVAVDVTGAGAAARVVDDHLAAHGRLDVLVANAGRGWRGSLAEVRDADLGRVFPVNVFGGFDLVRAALPALREAGAEHGNALVVVVASILGIRPAPGWAVYSASKAAIVSLARSITLEEADHGVRATAVCPGFVETDMTEGLQGVEKADMLTAADVAEAVGFLLRLSPGAAVPEIVIGRLDAGPYLP
jgi:NAD(P)-dependent dehydrogenase (short-subunit alcohol dehydrogenase family)